METTSSQVRSYLAAMQLVYISTPSGRQQASMSGSTTGDLSSLLSSISLSVSGLTWDENGNLVID